MAVETVSPVRRRTLTAAVLAVVLAAVTSFYGAFGDPHPSSAQKHGVPVIIGVGVVIAALLFGLLVPWARRLTGRAAGWGLALSIVGLLAIPMTFWSGFNVIVAAAGVVLGGYARPSRLGKAAVVVGVIAVVLSSAMVVAGNTVLA